MEKKKRRGHGGTYQRGDIWWIAYSFRGKLQRESSGSTKESDANKLLAKRIGEMSKGHLTVNEEKIIFADLAEDLRRDYEINGRRSVRSIRLSISHLEKFFEFFHAVDITTDKVREYISKRQAEGAANASINRELAALKRAFTLAVNGGRLTGKPHIAKLEENNARQGFLDYGDFLRLKAELLEYLRDPISFLYHSGWRVSEMRQVEWRDVDLAGGVIRFRPEISKNKKARVLPLRGELGEIIVRAAKNRRLDCVRVFHDKGQPIGDFRKAWHNACVAASLGRFDKIGEGQGAKKVYTGLLIHDFRRSAVRNLIKAGVPEKVAMEVTGHKTRAIFDRYHIVDESDLVSALDRTGAYLDSVADTGKVAAMKRKAKAE